MVRPVAHFRTQWPFEQTWFEAQACPQDPQFEWLWARDTQTPEQTTSPVGQWQCPAEQVAPAGHLCPQRPQLRKLVWRFTHRPLHRV